jgi:hypothetical protein
MANENALALQQLAVYLRFFAEKLPKTDQVDSERYLPFSQGEIPVAF